MIKSEQNEAPGFRFALPRLINRWRGETAVASEGSAAEAYAGSAALFIITFLAAWHLVAKNFTDWTMAIVAILLALVVWVFWVLVFFLNSLIIEALRRLGFPPRISNRAAQDVVITCGLAAFAVQLSLLPDWSRWIGMLFLLALAVNILAAAALGLRRDNI